MQIGDLFLSLGIKGTEKTVESIGTVKKGLSDTASVSLEAKAAIVGAMYALERLFSTSGKAGTELTNFNALTGESVQTLQKYQYAGRQVGISNEETANSFKSLQSAMTKTMLGHGAPAGLARVSQLTGGITQKDIQDFMKNPELLLQRLQEYAAREKNIGLRNETIKSFGLGDNVIAGLSRGAFNQTALNRAPTYSDKEIAQLDKANIAWSNLGTKIEMAVGHFNALHGGALVKEISGVVAQVIKLTESFVKLSDQLHFFEVLGKIFEGWADIFELISSTVDKITGNPKGPEEGVIQQGKRLGTGIVSEGSYFAHLGVDYVKNLLGNFNLGESILAAKGFPTQNSKNQNNHINITNNFQHPGLEHKKTEHSVKHAVNQAMRQLSSQTQAT